MALKKVSAGYHYIKGTSSVGGHKVSAEASWVPNTDVYGTDEGLVIKVELAGMRREDLELTVDGSALHIRGQRPDGCRAPNCKFIVMEINYGPFENVIELPEGYNLSKAAASYQNGFLRVDVPLKSPDSAKPHRVPVTSGEE